MSGDIWQDSLTSKSCIIFEVLHFFNFADCYSLYLRHLLRLIMKPLVALLIFNSRASLSSGATTKLCHQVWMATSWHKGTRLPLVLKQWDCLLNAVKSLAYNPVHRTHKSNMFIHQRWMISHPDIWLEPLSAHQWECAGQTPESSARQCLMPQMWPPPSHSRTSGTEPSCWSWRASTGGSPLSAQIEHLALSAAARCRYLKLLRRKWRFGRERWSGASWGQIHGCWGQVLWAGGVRALESPCWLLLPKPAKGK